MFAQPRFRRRLDLVPTVSTRGVDVNTQGNTAVVVGKYYNFPAAVKPAPAIAIISLGGTYLTSDIEAYRKLQNITAPLNLRYVNVGGDTRKANGEMVKGDGSEENTLDIEIASSLSPLSPIIVYFGSNNYQGFLQAITAAVAGPAKVISISWGGPETGFGGTLGLGPYETAFRAAQSAGKVVVAATGDKGSNNGTPSLAVDYPSSSPNVIACGGTSWVVGGGEETAWSWNPSKQWGGGGGVSTLFSSPYYQRSFSSYKGRTTPDLSLLANPDNGWSIYFQGVLSVNSWGGTSAAAPAVAALLALYNRPTYASMHQQIYNIANGDAFKDITKGSNANVSGQPLSYTAKKGYDLVTGWGSVHGEKLRLALG